MKYVTPDMDKYKCFREIFLASLKSVFSFYQDHEKSQVAEINLGCKDHDTEHTYRIFVTTFLGYGANEALARHRRDLVLSQVEKGVR